MKPFDSKDRFGPEEIKQKIWSGKNVYQLWAGEETNSWRIDIQDIKRVGPGPNWYCLKGRIFSGGKNAPHPKNYIFLSPVAGVRHEAHSVRRGHFSSRQTFSQRIEGGVVCSLQPSNRQSVGRSVRRWQHCESKHINWDASQAQQSVFRHFCNSYHLCFLD